MSKLLKFINTPKKLNSLSQLSNNKTQNNINLANPTVWWVVIGSYCLIFLLLRLTNITDFMISSDEARHLLRAQATLHGDIFIGLRDSLKQFYIWVVALLLPFSSDALFVGRGVSAIAGLATTFICYKLGQELYQSDSVGLIAALIYLISPYALFFDRLALTDSLLTMLMSLSLLLSVRLSHQATLTWAIWSGVIFACGLLTKVYTAIYLPAPLLAWLILGRKIPWQRLGQLLMVCYSLTIPAWLLIGVIGRYAYETDHYQKITPQQEANRFLIDIFSRNIAHINEWAFIYLTTPIVVMFTLGTILAIVTRYCPALFTLLMVGLYCFTFSVGIERLVPRYMLPTIVPVALIIGWSVTYFKQWVSTYLTTQPIYQVGIASIVFVLVGWPSLQQDYLIINDPIQFIQPTVEQEFFLGQQAQAYRDIAEFLINLAETEAPIIVLGGGRQNNIYHQMSALASLFIPYSLHQKIEFVELGTFDTAIPQTIFDQYAQHNTTLIVTTSEQTTADELVKFNNIKIPSQIYPKLWKLASFPQPNGIWKVEVYQWVDSQQTLSAIFDDRLQLAGFTVSNDNIIFNEPLQVNLYWQTLNKSAETHQVFVQLLNDNSDIVAQSNTQPFQQNFFSEAWQSGVRIADNHTLLFNEPLDEGEYNVVVEVYDLNRSESLPIQTKQGTDNLVWLTTVNVK